MAKLPDRRKFDPHNYYSGQALPGDLWYGHQDPLSLGQGASVEAVSKHLPGWLGQEALNELGRAQESDGRAGAWWANTWALLNQYGKPEAQDLALLLAMSVVYGLPATSAALREHGASVAPLPQPDNDARWGEGWRWGAGSYDRYRQRPQDAPLDAQAWSALSLCVAALRSDNTNTPLHADQSRALDDLLSAGADPNLIPAKILRKAIKHEPLVAILIHHGLDPYLPAPYHRQESAVLVEALMDDSLTLARAGRERILRRFLTAGMDTRAHDGRHLLDIAAAYPHGARLLPMIMDHFGSRITQDVRERAELLRQRARRWSEGDRAKLEDKIMETSTPVTSTKTTRMRL